MSLFFNTTRLSKRKKIAQDESDDESEDMVRPKEKGSQIKYMSRDKFERMWKTVAHLRRELAVSKQDNKEARAELAKLREEKIVQQNQKSDDETRANQLVLKHSAKVKSANTESAAKKTTRGNKKGTIKKSIVEPKKKN
jgi:hypothetical protein